MKRVIVACILFTLVGQVAVAEVLAKSPDGKLRVESLPGEVEKEFEGCSCYFSSPVRDSSPVLAWLYGAPEPTKAAIQVNGQTERLVLLGESSQRKKGRVAEPNVGDTTEFKFAKDPISAVLSCKVSQTCWGTPGCEYIGYSCSANVSAKGSQVNFSAQGGCGC